MYTLKQLLWLRPTIFGLLMQGAEGSPGVGSVRVREGGAGKAGAAGARGVARGGAVAGPPQAGVAREQHGRRWLRTGGKHNRGGGRSAAAAAAAAAAPQEGRGRWRHARRRRGGTAPPLADRPPPRQIVPGDTSLWTSGCRQVNARARDLQACGIQFCQGQREQRAHRLGADGARAPGHGGDHP